MFPDPQLHEILAEEGSKAATEALERARATSTMKAREAIIPIGGVPRDPGEGFRSLTQSERDLTPLSQERMIEIAHWLVETNPLARSIIRKFRDFLAGEGISWVAKDDKVDAVILKFWDDPVNNFSRKLPQKIQQLFQYGEQCYPAFVSENAGNVRLGYVDPANIKEVVADPDNCEVLLGVSLKSRGNKKGKRYKIIWDTDEEIASPAGAVLRESFTDGQCFYLAINNVSNSVRGRSELLSSADHLDAYEQFVFDRLDMRGQINAFIWDTTIEGKTQEEINEIAKTMPPPKRGTEFFHNERVKREAVTPDLKADDASADARLAKNHILAGHGFPPTWFAEGVDVNRASAAEMEPPTLKMMTMAQRVVKDMISDMVRYQIRKKIEAGELEEEIEIEEGGEKKIIKAVDAFQIVTPELSPKDPVKLGAALAPITSSLLIAESQDWITKEAAANVYVNVLAALGQEVEVAETASEEVDPNVTKDYRSQEARDKIRRAYAAGRR